MPDELRSKKLASLIVVLAALLVFFVVYALLSIWVDISDAVAVAVTTVINAMGLGHQVSQGAVDRASAQAGTYRVPTSLPSAPPAPLQSPTSDSSAPVASGSHIP